MFEFALLFIGATIAVAFMRLSAYCFYRARIAGSRR